MIASQPFTPDYTDDYAIEDVDGGTARWFPADRQIVFTPFDGPDEYFLDADEDDWVDYFTVIRPREGDPDEAYTRSLFRQ